MSDGLRRHATASERIRLVNEIDITGMYYCRNYLHRNITIDGYPIHKTSKLCVRMRVHSFVCALFKHAACVVRQYCDQHDFGCLLASQLRNFTTFEGRTTTWSNLTYTKASRLSNICQDTEQLLTAPTCQSTTQVQATMTNLTCWQLQCEAKTTQVKKHYYESHLAGPAEIQNKKAPMAYIFQPCQLGKFVIDIRKIYCRCCYSGLSY